MQCAQVISNMLAALHLVGVGEAFMLGKKAGIALPALFDALKASAGNSCALETRSGAPRPCGVSPSDRRVCGRSLWPPGVATVCPPCVTAAIPSGRRLNAGWPVQPSASRGRHATAM